MLFMLLENVFSKGINHNDRNIFIIQATGIVLLDHICRWVILRVYVSCCCANTNWGQLQQNFISNLNSSVLSWTVCHSLIFLPSGQGKDMWSYSGRYLNRLQVSAIFVWSMRFCPFMRLYETKFHKNQKF